jgi:hypothetical protein
MFTCGPLVQITVQQLSGDQTQDGQPHIYVENLQPTPSSGSSWNSSTASAIVAHFFTKDAHHVTDFQAPNGPDHVYRSSTLAATFTASDFIVVNGSGTVSPGTFDWQCVDTASNGRAGPPYNLCELGIGQNYAG